MVPARNELLAALPPDAAALLAPHLVHVALAGGTVLYEAGAPLDRAYLPETAVLSYVTEMADGSLAESASVGREGAVALVGAASTTVALRRVVVQVAGEAFALDVARVREAAERSAAFRDLLMWHSAVFQSVTFQLVACNARHTIEQRLARWLLQCRDRTGASHWSLKQDALARVLGVQRPGISLAAAALRRAGLIEHGRGSIEIRDADGLGGIACECYATMRRLGARTPRPIPPAGPSSDR